MNVFILNSGRCGSTSFIKACQHITNYSASHESRCHLTGEARLAYPDNHIEADNRLSWLLGRIDHRYGNNAFYVHLHRDLRATADSFEKRNDFGIMKAYREGILMNVSDGISNHEIAMDYLNTVDSNIHCFLKDKKNKITINLETIKVDFKLFWKIIGAQGSLLLALKSWDTRHNTSSGND